MTLLSGIILALANSATEEIGKFTGECVVTELNGLWSVKEDLKAIADDLVSIKSVLKDAEDMEYSNEAMKIWLTDLKSVVYDIDDLLDEVATSIKLRTVIRDHLIPRLRYHLSLKPLTMQFHLSHEIKKLRLKLKRVVVKKNTFGLTDRPVETPSIQRDVFDGSSYVNKLAIHGRDEAKNYVTNILSGLRSEESLIVLPIVGMGGIGKTALAKLVCNDIDQFEIKLWVCVFDKFEIKVILENLLKEATHQNTSHYSFQKLVEKLQEVLGGKKYFVVLDDLWEDDIRQWREFKNILDVGGKGSVILITARLETVAKISHTVIPYDLGKLSDAACWRIFKNLAFAEGEEERYPNLCEIGWSIVKKCCGIPLAVQSLGSLLRSVRNKEEWLQINNMDNFNQLDRQYNTVKKLLKLSYDKLSSHLKLVFTHLSLFPKDFLYVPEEHIYNYSALGLLQLHDENYSMENLFIELLSKSMLQDVERSYNTTICTVKIHDLLHELARDILGEDLVVVNDLNVSIPDSSRFIARHIAWRSSALPEFPQKLKAKSARSFMFQYSKGFAT